MLRYLSPCDPIAVTCVALCNNKWVLHGDAPFRGLGQQFGLCEHRRKLSRRRGQNDAELRLASHHAGISFVRFEG